MITLRRKKNLEAKVVLKYKQKNKILVQFKKHEFINNNFLT